MPPDLPGPSQPSRNRRWRSDSSPRSPTLSQSRSASRHRSHSRSQSRTRTDSLRTMSSGSIPKSPAIRKQIEDSHGSPLNGFIQRSPAIDHGTDENFPPNRTETYQETHPSGVCTRSEQQYDLASLCNANAKARDDDTSGSPPSGSSSARTQASLSIPGSQHAGNDTELWSRDNGEKSTEPRTIERSAPPIRTRNRNLLQSVQSYLSDNAPKRGRKHAAIGALNGDQSLASTKPENEDRNFQKIRRERDHSGVPSLLLRLSEPTPETSKHTVDGLEQIPRASHPDLTLESEASGSKTTSILSDGTRQSAMRIQTQSTHLSTSQASSGEWNYTGQDHHMSDGPERDIDSSNNGAMQTDSQATKSDLRPVQLMSVYSESTIPSIPTDGQVPADEPSTRVSVDQRSRLLRKLQEERCVHNLSLMPGSELDHSDEPAWPSRPPASPSLETSRATIEIDIRDDMTRREVRLREEARLRVRPVAAKHPAAAEHRSKGTAGEGGNIDQEARETSLRKMLMRRRHHQ